MELDELFDDVEAVTEDAELDLQGMVEQLYRLVYGAN